ncbi:hypothetical protein CEXT_453841, partial [Caerostris extrusa]
MSDEEFSDDILDSEEDEDDDDDEEVGMDESDRSGEIKQLTEVPQNIK